jgi:hypothetical protein
VSLLDLLALTCCCAYELDLGFRGIYDVPEHRRAYNAGVWFVPADEVVRVMA